MNIKNSASSISELFEEDRPGSSAADFARHLRTTWSAYWPWPCGVLLWAALYSFFGRAGLGCRGVGLVVGALVCALVIRGQLISLRGLLSGLVGYAAVI